MTDRTLQSQLVGISVSESDDLTQLGLAVIHLDHAFVELVRHLFAAGASIAYAGDLRPRGYTEVLLDLLRAYHREDRPRPGRVLNFVAWPGGPPQTVEEVAILARIATVIEVPPPQGAPSALPDPSEQTAQDRLWRSLSLTDMRTQMSTKTTARVLLGGRLANALGLVPGVAEEAALALRGKTPLYVLGGFGGCARLIADELSGTHRQELRLEYQLEYTEGYGDLWAEAKQRGVETSLEHVAKTIEFATWNDLRNGLTETENRRLASTDDVDEVIALVLHGLRGISPPDQGHRPTSSNSG